MIGAAPLLLVSVLFHASLSNALLPFPGLGQNNHIEHHDYSVAHSYPENTTFDEKDGWKRVFVSDLEYKYTNATITQQDRSAYGHGNGDGDGIAHRRSRTRKGKKAKSKSGSPGLAEHGGVLKDALKSVGKFIPVVITWYTGKDLENPSCWPNGHWTPTDDAFVCALTLRGWWDRPKCFSFIELCYGPSKCIFVRVVDTCAGCQDGSHHVDLTRGAFSHLANLDKGVLGVSMRAATIPSGVWNERLWGPK